MDDLRGPRSACGNDDDGAGNVEAAAAGGSRHARLRARARSTQRGSALVIGTARVGKENGHSQGGIVQWNGYGAGADHWPFLPVAASGGATWSMPQGTLPWNASASFFLRRISSSSGEERSGRKGTKMGLWPDGPDFAGDGRLGWGAYTGVVARMMGPCVPWLVFADAGTGCANCEGAAGLGRTAELLVKGWVASGSKEERTELDMVVVRVRGTTRGASVERGRVRGGRGAGRCKRARGGRGEDGTEGAVAGAYLCKSKEKEDDRIRGSCGLRGVPRAGGRDRGPGKPRRSAGGCRRARYDRLSDSDRQ